MGSNPGYLLKSFLLYYDRTIPSWGDSFWFTYNYGPNCCSFGFDPLEVFLDFLSEFSSKFFKKFDYKNQTPLWNFDLKSSKPFEISIGIQIEQFAYLICILLYDNKSSQYKGQHQSYNKQNDNCGWSRNCLRSPSITGAIGGKTTETK